MPRTITSIGFMDHLELRLQEFVEGGIKLIWRRVAMYVGASVLVGVYYSSPIAFVCFVLLIATELVDLLFVRMFLRARKPLGLRAASYYKMFFVSSALSTASVSGYALIVALQQGPGDHFMPMIFLLAAALFAAMNNHQFKGILYFRLFLYGVTFLAIPAIDIAILRPSIFSTYWLQMIVAIFILYFVVDTSLIFLRLYQERLHRLEELANENRRANSLLKEKNNLISVVSHELKTPLTTISGILSILAPKLKTANVSGLDGIVLRAQENARRLHEIVNDMLDLRAIERGDFALIPEVFDLRKLVAPIVERKNAFEAQDRYHLTTIGTCDELIVHADRSRLARIIENLISNAGKFSPSEADVLVEIDCSHPAHVVVSVSDQGSGLSEEQQSRVFMRFSQVSSEHNRSSEGIGLGLNLAKSIIHLHGGDISVTSKLGSGSTFRLTLPKQRQPGGALTRT